MIYKYISIFISIYINIKILIYLNKAAVVASSLWKITDWVDKKTQ